MQLSRRADKYCRTRASGSSVSRSVMTATDAAPASMTRGAVSSVMPPIATTGSPAAAAQPAAAATAREPDRLVAGGLGRRREDRADREIGDRLRQRARRSDPAVCVEKPTIASGPIDAPDVSRRQVVLADVHAVGAGQHGDVGAIVDDQLRRRAARASSAIARPRARETRRSRGSWRAAAAAGAAGQERARDVVGAPSGARADVDIDDGVEDGKRARDQFISCQFQFKGARPVEPPGPFELTTGNWELTCVSARLCALGERRRARLRLVALHEVRAAAARR